jgi:hypothetical protein
LQQEQVLQGALIHAVHAGFVTVHQGEGFGIGHGVEGGGQAARAVARVLGVDAVGKQASLDGPGAAHAPPGGDHFLDDVELDGVGRLEALQILGQGPASLKRPIPERVGVSSFDFRERAVYAVPPAGSVISASARSRPHRSQANGRQAGRPAPQFRAHVG